MRRSLVVVAALAGCGGGGGGPACGLGDATFCDRLSDYGLFDDLATQTPAAGVMPYGVNTPLFTDYANKDRFVYLPPGTTIAWRDTTAFELPVGAALVKTFSYGDRHLETRLLVKDAAGWRGAAYTYVADGNDAELAIAGAAIDATVTDPMGVAHANHYLVPNKNQCKNCHAETDDAIGPLGPKARHVRPADLEAMIVAGALVDAPAAETWPRAIVATDPATGTVDERARAWLDINCAHCHNPQGAARTSGLFLDRAETNPETFGVCKPPVAAGRGSGGRAYGIVPGQPDASILLFRIESTEAEIKMPELGRNLVDDAGAALIRDWIAQLPGSCP